MTRREPLFRLWAALLVLAGAFLLLYQPWNLGLRELFWDEGSYAVQAQEMGMAPPLASAHGVALPGAFPLYPLLTSILRQWFPLSMEMALRVLSVAAAAGIAVIVGFAAGSARNARAGVVAAAMYLSMNLIMEKALDGYPDFCAAFFLLAAQLAYFYFGMRHSAWSWAWISSALFLSAAFYTGGFWYIVYFVFPLIFLRRPLAVGTRWLKPGFAIGCALLGGTILLWLLPYLTEAETRAINPLFADSISLGDYLLGVLEYPWNLALRLLPWTLLAWIPFCVALFRVDDTPLYSRYLRTIFISTFFLLWFRPGMEPRDFALLAAPLSIMVGLNYEMAVRRYAIAINRLLLGCEYALYAMAAGLLGFLFAPEWILQSTFSLTRPLTFRHELPALFYTLAALAALLLFAIFFHFRRERSRPVWLLLLMTGVATGLFYWNAMTPYRAQSQVKRQLGRELRAALAADLARLDRPELIVYKYNIQDLYGECFYSGVTVRKIAALAALPPEDSVVYVLSTTFPQHPERIWSNLLAPDKTYRNHQIGLWKGVPRDNE